MIFAKKLMRPILSAMNKEEFNETIKKLDSSEARTTMQQIFNSSKTKSQQESLSDLANFGLRNISGFTKILELITSLSG